jgi:hypothetical protein
MAQSTPRARYHDEGVQSLADRVLMRRGPVKNMSSPNDNNA